ncbi:methyltransferase [Patescibacteria group bacterium]
MLLLTVVKGLEDIAEGELANKLSDFSIVKKDAGHILIEYNGHPRRLLDLRTIEDVFYVIFTQTDLDRSRASLRIIKEQIQHYSFDDALKYHSQLYSKSKRPTHQVFAHLYGRRNFRRADLEQVVSNAIKQKFHQWKAVHGKAKLEFDVRLFKDGEAIMSLRLTDKYFSNRKYKVADIPGSLKPTVAAALVMLSKPQDTDVFLDPFCGAGTILMERSLINPAKQIIGSDLDKFARQAAIENTTKRGGIEIHDWDATSLPLPDQSIDVIITNPPFGKKIAQTENLFTKFLSEAGRVIKKSGRLVVLNSDVNGFEQALDTKKFRQQKRKDIMLLGEAARVWVFVKN